MVGMVDGNGHPYSWSAIFNGFDAAAMAHCPYPVIPEYLSRQPAAALGIATPSAGTHAITAGYGASVGNFTGGSGSVEEVVRPATAGTDRMASVAVRPAGAGLTRGGLRAAMHRSVASGPASVNDLALMSLLDESSG